ncbi:hypothetical protein ACLOJK_014334 [Asimina triloba]
MPTKIPKIPFPSILRLASINARGFSAAATETRTQKLERIADELLDLTKLERYDYSILFRLKMGLNRYGPSVTLDSSSTSSAAGSSGAAAGAESKAEKTAFDIKLEKFDAAAKIKIIKEVRTFTDLGLKEAKDLVEKAPVVLKKGVTKEEASPIVEKLKGLGATVDGIWGIDSFTASHWSSLHSGPIDYGLRLDFGSWIFTHSIQKHDFSGAKCWGLEIGKLVFASHFWSLE